MYTGSVIHVAKIVSVGQKNCLTIVVKLVWGFEKVVQGTGFSDVQDIGVPFTHGRYYTMTA
jgi:hypothetical protein